MGGPPNVALIKGGDSCVLLPGEESPGQSNWLSNKFGAEPENKATRFDPPPPVSPTRKTKVCWGGALLLSSKHYVGVHWDIQGLEIFKADGFQKCRGIY